MTLSGHCNFFVGPLTSSSKIMLFYDPLTLTYVKKERIHVRYDVLIYFHVDRVLIYILIHPLQGQQGQQGATGPAGVMGPTV